MQTLRRWEIAERQRRKAARGSTSLSSPPSLVGDVSRRASLLWSGRKSKHSSLGGLGNHSALRSQDNVPLTQIDASPTPSPTRSDSDEAHPAADPFANPPESQSPFADSHVAKIHDSQLPSSSRLPVTSFESHIIPVHVPLTRPPPPKPLNLPPPRTPPPIIDTQSPTSPSTSIFGNQSTPKEENIRWWHDWLCGCGEGPDRGGDFQVLNHYLLPNYTPFLNNEFPPRPVEQILLNKQYTYFSSTIIMLLFSSVLKDRRTSVDILDNRSRLDIFSSQRPLNPTLVNNITLMSNQHELHERTQRKPDFRGNSDITIVRDYSQIRTDLFYAIPSCSGFTRYFSKHSYAAHDLNQQGSGSPHRVVVEAWVSTDPQQPFRIESSGRQGRRTEHHP